jgi:hypothetical protein
VEFDDEFVVDFALHFFLGNHESGEPVISPLLHALHCKKVVGVHFLDKEDLRIRAPTQTSNTLEVFGCHVEVLVLGCLCNFSILFDVEQHVGCLFDKFNHLHVAIITCVVKGCLFELIQALGSFVACGRKLFEEFDVALNAGQMHCVLQFRILHFHIDVVLHQQVEHPLVIIDHCIMQGAVACATFLEIHIYRLILSVVNVDEFGNPFIVALFGSLHELITFFEIRFPPWAPHHFV